MQIAAARIPIREDPAFAPMSIDDMLMQRRPVRMSMNEAWIAMASQHRFDSRGRDIHDRVGLELLFLGIFGAQPRDDLFTAGERPREKLPLIGGDFNLCSECLGIEVVTAQ